MDYINRKERRSGWFSTSLFLRHMERMVSAGVAETEIRDHWAGMEPQ